MPKRTVWKCSACEDRPCLLSLLSHEHEQPTKCPRYKSRQAIWRGADTKDVARLDAALKSASQEKGI